tara:strand:+ start:1812 stop:2882 length:1071 start_codon:yes stop_codon:yes gene_type:complete
MSDKKIKKDKVITNDEIDIIKLFSLIGKGFSNFFNFLGQIIKWFFNFFIIILIFIKQHILKVVIALVIGASLGILLDSTTPKRYSYDMIIQPNYNSIDQIFEFQEYYNTLIINVDTLALAKKFNISNSSASNLHSFSLTPYESEKEQILAFNSFLKKTDSLVHKHFTFNDFKGFGTSKYDSEFYIYRIESYDSNLKSLEEPIISEIEKNKHLARVKKIRQQNLRLDSIATVESIVELDSLRSLYKRVTLLEVENQKNSTSTSTYIDFSKDDSQNNNDIKFFEVSKSLKNNLIEIELKKETSENIVNIITSFNPRGKNRYDFLSSKTFKLPVIFGILVFLYALLKPINNYLTEYGKK